MEIDVSSIKDKVTTNEIVESMREGTREASEYVMPIHNRMPVILKPGAFASWLDRENQDIKSLQDIIQSQVITILKSVPVSSQVNSVKINRPDNIKPVG